MSQTTDTDSDTDSDTTDARAQLAAAREEIPNTEPMLGGLAVDLVTRQLLMVSDRVADDLPSYYEAEGFDLYNYKMHPYLPVEMDDPVYQCVYVNDVTLEGLSDWSGTKTYDFPRGRLVHVPVEQSWLDLEGE